jgi:hypothetical protein
LLRIVKENEAISYFACLLFLTFRHGDFNVAWGANIESDKLGEGEFLAPRAFFRFFYGM